VKQEMTEFVGADHSLHLLAHIPVNEDEFPVQDDLAETFLLLCVDISDGYTETGSDLKRIPCPVFSDQ
jgi:hypothetical protein